jgi:MFS family permease
MRQKSSRSGPYREALSVPEFRAIFCAWTASITGTVVSSVALTVLVYERTGSPLLSSLTFALGFLPYAIGGTLLSGIVDRVPPRRLLVACDLVSSGLTATMALPGLPLAVLLVLLAGTSTLTSISSGTRGALVRSIVPEASYVPARSLLRIAAQTAQIAGNAVGGALLVVLTLRGAILVNAASFLVSATLMRFRLGQHSIAGSIEEANLLVDSVRGLRRVFAHATLRRLLLLGWLVPMFSVAPEALAAPSVASTGGSPALVGWWLVALPAGTVAGDLLGVWGLTPDRQRRMLALAAGASFLPYLAFLTHPGFAAALVLLFIAGLCALYSLGLDALIRQAAPEHLFARAMTVNTAGLITLQGLGFVLAGAIAEATGPATAIAVAGVCGIVTVVLLHPRSRDLPNPKRTFRPPNSRQRRIAARRMELIRAWH